MWGLQHRSGVTTIFFLLNYKAYLLPLIELLDLGVEGVCEGDPLLRHQHDVAHPQVKTTLGETQNKSYDFSEPPPPPSD